MTLSSTECPSQTHEKPDPPQVLIRLHTQPMNPITKRTNFRLYYKYLGENDKCRLYKYFGENQ